jgi:uncharacterized protein with HEPN domain
MPANRDQAAILDIVQAAKQIQNYINGLDFAQLEADDKTQAAVLYRIIILGEAVKRISRTFRDQPSRKLTLD